MLLRGGLLYGDTLTGSFLGDRLGGLLGYGRLTGLHGLALLLGRLLTYRDLSTHQDGGCLTVHVVYHCLEQVVRFKFVDQQRILVLVASVLYGVAQLIHLT